MDRDLKLALMVGVDIPIIELQTSIHAPTIKEIALMGEKDFFAAMQYLCIDKTQVIQDKNILATLTNFQVLMKVLGQSSRKGAVQTLLTILFPPYNSVILPASIILSAKDKEPITIDENNFDIVQEYIKEILCATNLFQGDNIIYKPANKKAREIAAKMMKNRKKVAEIKSRDHKEESVLTRYISLLTIGTSTMSLRDCANLTLFQLFDLIERYMAFVESDVDMRVRLQGGKPEKQVESWMRDLYTNK